LLQLRFSYLVVAIVRRLTNSCAEMCCDRFHPREMLATRWKKLNLVCRSRAGCGRLRRPARQRVSRSAPLDATSSDYAIIASSTRRGYTDAFYKVAGGNRWSCGWDQRCPRSRAATMRSRADSPQAKQL